MSTVATKSVKTGKPAGLDAIFRPFTLKFGGGQISYGPAKAGGSGPPPKGGLKAPSARRTYAAVVRRERPGSGVAAPERSMPSAAPAATDENVPRQTRVEAASTAVTSKTMCKLART